MPDVATITERAPQAKAPRTCKWPGCEHPDPQPPYRYLRDGIPSVTAISGMVDLGKSSSFGYAAALIAATTAVHERTRWEHMATHDCGHEKDTLCAACRFLRGEHAAQWDAKATLGSHVHHMAESWARGEDVEEDEATRGYLDAIEAFYCDRRPAWQMVECTVHGGWGTDLAYRGKFDGICELDCPAHGARRCPWLVDWKSGAFYPAEQTIQLAGYRNAALSKWTGKTERITGPVPDVAHCGVVLLRDDGTYRLEELPADESAYEVFRALRSVYGWHGRVKKAFEEAASR